jgi:formylmethanofuran dehydrogenase subunit D
MDSLVLTLITGRTTRQGTGISTGKGCPDYQEATSVVELNPIDMERAGLNDGDHVRLSTEFGSTDVACRRADIPKGLAFMAFGPACNRLVGDETHASGMPDSKNVVIELIPVPRNTPKTGNAEPET